VVRGLSLALRSLVADSLLKWLTEQGVFARGFADDGVRIVEKENEMKAMV